MCLLKPTKEITHDPATGAMKIRTITTLRNFNMDFTIGKEFTEDLGPVDGRTCQVCVVCFDLLPCAESFIHQMYGMIVIQVGMSEESLCVCCNHPLLLKSWLG